MQAPERLHVSFRVFLLAFKTIYTCHFMPNLDYKIVDSFHSYIEVKELTLESSVTFGFIVTRLL